MPISTKNIGVTTVPNNDSKRSLIIELMKHHKELFEKEGVHNPKFIPRLCYKHNGEKIIGFYPRELYGGVDIYIEFCGRDYTPEDPERILWKWVYNPEFSSEYELSEPHAATKDQRYLIPIKNLINVTKLHSEITKEPIIVESVVPINNSNSAEVGALFHQQADKIITVDRDNTLDEIPPKEVFIIAENTGAGSDVPYDAMTLRDYAAIQWKIPVSHKKWLNELITKHF